MTFHLGNKCECLSLLYVAAKPLISLHGTMNHLKNQNNPRLESLDQQRKPMVVPAIALMTCFCLMLIGLHAWSLWISHQGELEDSATTTKNMARALASHAERSFNIADSVLAEMVERVGQDGLDRRNVERMHSRMAGITRSSAEIQELFIYGADGTRLVSSLPTLLPGSDDDRDFFRYHMTHTNLNVYIGKPIRSRSSGIMTMPISRRINRADGSFGGVAMAALKLNYFGKFYDSFDLGPTGTIILALDDGTLLYRRPFKAAMVGTSIASGPVFQLYKKSGPTGTAMLTSKLDGIERLYSYRHLDGFPLLVATAQTKDEILNGWRIAVIKMSCVVTFAVCILAWGAFHMIRQLRVREVLEAELRAAHTSLELHNVSLSQLAETDSMTGLANRRRFEKTLITEQERAKRSGLPFSLIMLDVDYFKKFNDRYGHVAGDDCLRLVGNAIATGPRRPTDLAARYGGEEFAIILPETDSEGALAVAEKVRLAVQTLGITHSESLFGLVTISLGVHTCYPAHDANTPPLYSVQAADQMLYRAKMNGRNCVETDLYSVAS